MVQGSVRTNYDYYIYAEHKKLRTTVKSLEISNIVIFFITQQNVFGKSHQKREYLTNWTTRLWILQGKTLERH